MNCPNCQHEIADDVQICPNCGANVAAAEDAQVAPTPATPSSVAINMNGARKIPFVVAFFALCLVAVGYIAYVVCNIALKGDMVANAGFITSMVGRVAVSLIRGVILVFAVIAIVSIFKAYKSKGDLFNNMTRFSYLFKVLSIFAIFTILDMFVIFFFALIGNSVVGDTLTYKTNYELIEVITNFWGYDGLKLSKTLFKGAEDGTLALVCAVGFGLFCFVYSIYNAVVMSKLKDYTSTLTGLTGGYQYDKDTKSPFVWTVIVVPFYIFSGVASIIAGVYVNAIIQLGMAIFLCALAFAFKGLHKDLLRTSAD